MVKNITKLSEHSQAENTEKSQSTEVDIKVRSCDGASDGSVSVMNVNDVCFMLLSAFRQPQVFQNAAARAPANVNKTDDIGPGPCFAVASRLLRTRLCCFYAVGFVLKRWMIGDPNPCLICCSVMNYPDLSGLLGQVETKINLEMQQLLSYQKSHVSSLYFGALCTYRLQTPRKLDG